MGEMGGGNDEWRLMTRGEAFEVKGLGGGMEAGGGQKRRERRTEKKEGGKRRARGLKATVELAGAK